MNCLYETMAEIYLRTRARFVSEPEVAVCDAVAPLNAFDEPASSDSVRPFDVLKPATVPLSVVANRPALLTVVEPAAVPPTRNRPSESDEAPSV
jgi:hypothetical protein